MRFRKELSIGGMVNLFLQNLWQKMGLNTSVLKWSYT